MRPVIRRKSVQKTAAPNDWVHLAKLGEDHRRAAETALMKNNWGTVGTSSVHAASAMAEALLAHAAGIRTASESPGEIIYLLLRHLPPDSDVYLSRLLEVLDYKTLAKLEGRPLQEGEGRDCFEKAGRFLRWALQQLPAVRP